MCWFRVDVWNSSANYLSDFEKIIIMSQIIEALEKENLQQRVEFSPGDTVSVSVKVKEGERERLQNFQGVVIAKKNRGVNSSFTVRKISYGVGVERVFQTHSPLIASIKVERRGVVRRAKIYYLRDRVGKAARIREKLDVNKAK